MWVMFLGSFLAWVCGEDRLVASFDGLGFSKLQVYEDQLYIGARNNLHRLNADLSKNVTISTKCSGTTNDNKILLVNGRTDELVTCGTGCGGRCELRSLSDLSTNISTPYALVSTDRNRPAQAMLTELAEQRLILAVTYGEGLAEESSEDWYLISTRYSKSNAAFHVDNDKDIKLRDSVKDEDFLIYYKAALQYDGYSYFVTNQKAFVGREASVSKVARVCQGDKNKMYSYTDVIIQCSSNKTDGVFNLVQDAVFMTSGNERILVAAFASGSDPENPGGRSKICTVSLETLNQSYVKAAQEFLKCSPNSDQYYMNKEQFYLPVNRHTCINFTEVILQYLKFLRVSSLRNYPSFIPTTVG